MTTKRHAQAFGITVLIATTAVFIFYESMPSANWNSAQETAINAFSFGTSSTLQNQNSESQSSRKEPASDKLISEQQQVQHRESIHVLVHGRMTTGSKATATFFAKRPDFLYAYEPGLLMLHLSGNNPRNDSRDNLAGIQTELCDFFGELYTCNFTPDGYFTKGMNSQTSSLYRARAHVNTLPRPITARDLKSICRARPHIISKVVRLNDVTTCLPVLKTNNVKVIFLVRDPRALARSRHHWWLDRYDEASGGASGVIHPQLEETVREDCIWLETNFNSILHGPEWLRVNSMMIRYEDMSAHPDIIQREMFEFVGLPPPEEPNLEPSHNGSITKWLQYFTYEEIKYIQDLCPDHIYETFGWIKVKSREEFKNPESDWFKVMPKDGRVFKYAIP